MLIKKKTTTFIEYINTSIFYQNVTKKTLLLIVHE